MRKKTGWLSFDERLRNSERNRIAAENELRELKSNLRLAARVDDRVWFDADNKLWFTHNCLGMTVDTPLDGGWKISSSGRITPSIRCLRCEAHFTAEVQMHLHYIEGFKSWNPTRTATPILPMRIKTREETNGSSNRGTEGRSSRWGGDF